MRSARRNFGHAVTYAIERPVQFITDKKRSIVHLHHMRGPHVELVLFFVQHACQERFNFRLSIFLWNCDDDIVAEALRAVP